MSKILIDTDAYIDFLRTGRFDEIIRALYTFRTPHIHFSAVVAEELLQGANDSLGRKQAQALFHPFKKAGRLIHPSLQNWLDTGNILSKIRQKAPNCRGKLNRLINDTLIAMTAKQIGAVVYTSNRRDFELIAKFQPFLFEFVKGSFRA